MQIIPVQELREGDTLAKGLYAPDGRLMLKQGIALNESLIEGIKRRGHRYVTVEMEGSRSSAAFEIKRNLMHVSKDVLSLVFHSLREHTAFPRRALAEWTDIVATTVTEAPELTFDCRDMVIGDDELVSHSLNVCFLALLAAKALGYSKKKLKEIAIGSLLHDVGLALPHDDRLMLHHPLIGYDYLRKQSGIPAESLRIVLQHHEQIDGRGFPYGISDGHFLEAAQICGLASDFDYFMNDRESDDRPPSEGIDFVMSKIDSSYGYPVVRAFLHAFQPYPVGTRVTLSGSLRGTVRAVNKANPGRPVVELDESGMKIDLMKHMTFHIVKMIRE
ncbi:HD-GYP domain-containing protein [Cohnella suwonensis]|uniref:HD-GYP domain-containing protein n=1 Tax=Cohnella suwonensis TaxID=696072 RepID=A0ABW0LUY2_9BACL